MNLDHIRWLFRLQSNKIVSSSIIVQSRLTISTELAIAVKQIHKIISNVGPVAVRPARPALLHVELYSSNTMCSIATYHSSS